MQKGFRVVFPSPKNMVELGYPKLSFVPFLIGDEGDYPIEANRYLRERATLEWIARLTESAPEVQERRRQRFQTKQSCEAMARRLMEFLLWCESTTPTSDWRESLMAISQGVLPNIRDLDDISQKTIVVEFQPTEIAPPEGV